MASLVKIRGKRSTTWRIDFFLSDKSKRRSIRLGTMQKRHAEAIKTRLELLIAAAVSGVAPDADTARWAAERDDNLYMKMVHHGLVAPRDKRSVPTLAEFIDDYTKRRTDVQHSTIVWYRQTRRNLVAYFGKSRRLDEITIGETKDFRRWLTRPKSKDNSENGGQGLGENTARKRCAIAKQMFADAVDRDLIPRNPFAKMEGLTVGPSDGREYFVTRAEAEAVLAACPDIQWQLIFALSRYGGLRCPSELLALCWGDIDFERGRILIRSSKTKRHEGKAQRIVPLIPELRPYLEAALKELLSDFDPKVRRLSEQPVITHYRDTNSNLRTQLLRIIAKAKLAAWPKLFQNLRASRATELAAEFPAHVAATWMGHSTTVADKHYWRVTEADSDRATGKAQQKAQQKASEPIGMDGNPLDQKREKPGDYENRRVPLVLSMLPVGLEPTTY